MGLSTSGKSFTLLTVKSNMSLTERGGMPSSVAVTVMVEVPSPSLRNGKNIGSDIYGNRCHIAANGGERKDIAYIGIGEYRVKVNNK